jgi:hypothetical protein
MLEADHMTSCVVFGKAARLLFVSTLKICCTHFVQSTLCLNSLIMATRKLRDNFICEGYCKQFSFN